MNVRRSTHMPDDRPMNARQRLRVAVFGIGPDDAGLSTGAIIETVTPSVRSRVGFGAIGLIPALGLATLGLALGTFHQIEDWPVGELVFITAVCTFIVVAGPALMSQAEAAWYALDRGELLVYRAPTRALVRLRLDDLKDVRLVKRGYWANWKPDARTHAGRWTGPRLVVTPNQGPGIGLTPRDPEAFMRLLVRVHPQVNGRE